jgi:hypothetical protein
MVKRMVLTPMARHIVAVVAVALRAKVLRLARPLKKMASLPL